MTYQPPEPPGVEAPPPAPTEAEPIRDAQSPVQGRGARRRHVRRRRRRIVFSLLAAIVLLLIALVAWYEIEANPLGSQGKDEVVSISDNEAVGQLTSELASRGVISSGLAFKLSFVFHGTPTLQPGQYLFHQNQSFGAVRSVLSNGPDVYTLKVPAGFTLAEVTQTVGELPWPSEKSFTKALSDGSVRSEFEPSGSSDLEGMIGTGAYEVLPGETAKQLLSAMVQRFDQEARAAGFTGAASALGVTSYQLVTVASIVEKEGYIPKNMGQVARVIYNRLAAGQPLQMDSTVLYSLGQDGGPVSAADEALNTPYNTYLHTGLPPTPICTPSIDALKAAAHPTPGPWLYFEVVSKDGTEQFSDTFAEQLAAEKLAQANGIP